jgi:hypothetical protein
MPMQFYTTPFGSRMGIGPPPPRGLGGPPSLFLSVDGGRSQNSSSNTPRGPTADVFMLIVGSPGSVAPAPPRGAAIDVS